MRRTKIVATLGPASERVEDLMAILRAGVDVARLNMSHGSHEEHRQRLAAVRAAAQRIGRRVAVMVDTKGPEIRLGVMAEGKVLLVEGDRVVLTNREVLGRREELPVQYPDLAKDVQVGGTLLVDDGNLAFRILDIDGGDVICQVLTGGVISDRKKINLPGQHLSLPAVSVQDEADLRFAVEEGADFIAASFVRGKSDVLAVRRVLEAVGGRISIIAKVENQEGIDNLEEILQVADGLMVARGDMGVEVPPEEVPLIQKRMIRLANKAGKPVITATQMLESMIQKPRPTRAEASDVANAIFDGTDAVMLSAETAVGSYPVEAVRVMAAIAERAEASFASYRSGLPDSTPTGDMPSVTDAISHATCSIAQELDVAAILTATQSGHTARMVAKYRPAAHIIAVTPEERVARRMALVWGVVPLVVTELGSTDQMVERAVAAALGSGLVSEGDLVVITAGVPVGIPGTTNLVKVHTVGNVLVRGRGIGPRSATGPIRKIESPEDLEKVQEGEVVVARGTDPTFLMALGKAVALVTEEGGLTSHGALTGLSLGIPVVVGAEGALVILPQGELVTIDGSRGLVYRGRARVL